MMFGISARFPRPALSMGRGVLQAGCDGRLSDSPHCATIDIRFYLSSIYFCDTNMILTWDAPKRHANLAKHGMDFIDLTPDFFGQASVYPAKDGRFLAVGFLERLGFVAVVFALLGSEAVSIISMRTASMKERRSMWRPGRQ
jgi:uncharacterized protein